MVSLTNPGPYDALVVVDLQKDFLPGGSLAVPDGDRVVPVVNDLIKSFRLAHRPVFATRDWHPPKHCSFKQQGGTWPVHCVKNTRGAEFADDADIGDDVTIISKATEQDVESYSGFHRTDLASRLRSLGVKRIVAVGLATDYCVLHTVLDALDEDFGVAVVEDGIAAVEVEVGDARRAIERMRSAGAEVVAGLGVA
ncbi:MAG: isochorismatase family protein [Rhodothermia bacterium]|nr:isochorismatase family protein [Rhodothermia bacterium]